MKERGKAVEVSNGNGYNCSDFNYSCSSDVPCKKHPSSTSGGICAYCLKDRLIKLVCSDCGEQRLSSCSCSDISSYRNSCSTVDVGSVGRISFLIENEKTETLIQHSHSKSKNSTGERSEEVIFLKRSNSSCVEVKRSNGFWKIGRLFRKKRNKGNVGCDEKSEMWVSDYVGVSRSRSLCSFRGEGGGSEFAFSSAKISDVNGGLFLDGEAEPRKSGFKGLLQDGENGPNRNVCRVKESDFSRLDESSFIDLKLDLSSESKLELTDLKMVDLPISASDFGSFRGETVEEDQVQVSGNILGNLKKDGVFVNGGSCRITVNERRMRKGSKGYKVWRWIFRHNTGWRGENTKDGDQNLKP